MTDPLYWLPEELEPIAFRLARADECAYEIGDLTSAWSSNSPVRMYETVDSGIVTAKVDSIRPIPPKVALLFSEAINHIRASIDNVVWYLVEKEVGVLDPQTELLVVFPITRDSTHFSSWCAKRVKNGLTMFAEDSGLGRRLRTLQPWQDTISRVPSSSLSFSAIRRQPVEHAGALTLLQKYSNSDKHRSVKLTVSRTFSSHYDRPIFDQDLSPQLLTPGVTIHQIKQGEMSLLELNTAAVVVRPEPFTEFVNPVSEINWLRKYASETVIPMLLVGLTLDRGLPPNIDLSDTGETYRERLSDAGQDDAIERLRRLLIERLGAAMDANVSFMEKRTQG